MLKKILKKIDDFVGDTIAGIIINNTCNGPSRLQRIKWKIEDWIKK